MKSNARNCLTRFGCCFLFFCTFLLHAQFKKMNGVSFVASPNEIDSSHIASIKASHANWAAVMPFGYVKNLQSRNLVFNIKNQWWGEHEEGARKTIVLLQEQGVKVMLKPQLWVWKGEFTGDIEMNSAADWQIFESGYEKFILRYAQVAAELDVPILCIGTELSGFFKARPQFWERLIDQVRTIYAGKLTYAGNWDTYMNFPAWCLLDYIGVDAYFPISDLKTPTVATARAGWKIHKKELQNFQQHVNIPILFTEFGYRSVDYAGSAPWDASRVLDQVNLEAQLHLTQALFEEFWDEPWFAGGFIWKWFHNHEQSGGFGDNRFTPQNKPAAGVIAEWYRTKG